MGRVSLVRGGYTGGPREKLLEASLVPGWTRLASGRDDDDDGGGGGGGDRRRRRRKKKKEERRKKKKKERMF